MSLIEASSVNHLDVLIEINSHELNNDDKERLRDDFRKGYFQVYFLTTEPQRVDVASTLAYVVTYISYSTWQNRVLTICDFWLRSGCDVDAVVDAFRPKLFALARENNCKRVNFHVKHVDTNVNLIACLQRCGMRNLTRDEDWNLFQLGSNELKEFVRDEPPLDSDKFEIVKVENMNEYAKQIYGHIHELSVYEKLEEQFECSIEELLNDYDPEKCPSKNRLYEAMVIINKESNKTVGFALYYHMYDLKSGQGYYLEDLFIQESFRGHGLGTILWKRVANDCIRLNANYMQWAVLGWNTSAINFYYKFKAVNLTEVEKLNLFRFLTHQIYEKLTDH